MPPARPRPYFRLLFVHLLAAMLAACAHAPGMTLDAGSDDLKARANLQSIDTPTLRQLQTDRRTRLADEAAALPAAFRSSTARYDYLVAPQDVLRITVWNQPELTNPANTTTELSGRVVNSDGSMFFPYVGKFQAAGLAVQDIRALLVKGLSRVIKSPQVDVSVLQYRGQRVYVSGEVRTPGAVPVTDVPPDLADVIARSGGSTAEADLSAVTITRGAATLRVNLQALYYNGDGRANLRLQNGDIVNVPERRFARVFVTGEVLRQAALPMPRGDMTLADALADAGGVNPLSANAGQVFVIRASTDPKPFVYHLNAAAPDALLLADQFVLQARDVVYVDTAPVVRWSRLINNVLPSASFLRDTWTDNRITR
ncbi:polysaccharide biosynthesis/export family protein [Rhizobacter fulvus]